MRSPLFGMVGSYFPLTEEAVFLTSGDNPAEGLVKSNRYSTRHSCRIKLEESNRTE